VECSAGCATRSPASDRVGDPLFLLDALADPLPEVGTAVHLDGAEGRHAAVVRRIQPGETVLIGDGRGRAVRGAVSEVSKTSLVMTVAEQIVSAAPARRYVAVQALPKGDRAELAVEMLTEVGVAEIIPWRAERSIVRWTGERGQKGLARWRSTAREAAKQSRRLNVPVVGEPVNTGQLVRAVSEADLALILHEDASEPLWRVHLPDRGTVMIVIGPEGGISPAELDDLVSAGARPVLISDGILRTSTAGVVALAVLRSR
jgi:16S rRNA (uracil1498-N3)-methyltransferase